MAFAFSVGSGGEGSSSDERTGKAIANYVEHNGTKYVVDGHYRLSVAKKLILKEVPIEQVKLPYKGYKTVEDLLWFH